MGFSLSTLFEWIGLGKQQPSQPSAAANPVVSPSAAPYVLQAQKEIMAMRGWMDGVFEEADARARKLSDIRKLTQG